MLKLNNIDYLINVFKDIHAHIQNLNKESQHLLQRLRMYTEDVDWMSALTDSIVSNETNLLLKFPLEFNRVTTCTENIEDYRTLLPYGLSSEKIDSNNLQAMSSILECPSSFPENLLMRYANMMAECRNLKNLCKEKPTYDVKQCKWIFFASFLVCYVI